MTLLEEPAKVEETRLVASSVTPSRLRPLPPGAIEGAPLNFALRDFHSSYQNLNLSQTGDFTSNEHGLQNLCSRISVLDFDQANAMSLTAILTDLPFFGEAIISRGLSIRPFTRSLCGLRRMWPSCASTRTHQKFSNRMFRCSLPVHFPCRNSCVVHHATPFHYRLRSVPKSVLMSPVSCCDQTSSTHKLL